MSEGFSLDGCPLRTTLPAMNLERAKRFYSEVLGLRIVSESSDGVAFETDGANGGEVGSGWTPRATFFVYPTSNPARGGHTQMGFLVGNIEETVAALRDRGVTFEEYQQRGLETADGIAVIAGGRGKGAWFKDSEGNLIGLVQFG